MEALIAYLVANPTLAVIAFDVVAGWLPNSMVRWQSVVLRLAKAMNDAGNDD